MSRLTIIALVCLFGAIYCDGDSQWHAALQFLPGPIGPMAYTIQSLWVDNSNPQAPRVKLMWTDPYDATMYSYTIVENQLYGVHQNMTSSLCTSLQSLTQQEVALLQAIVGFSNGATYAGQILSDGICEQWVANIGNGNVVSMCFGPNGVPVSFSVTYNSATYTARMMQYTVKFYDKAVFRIPKGCGQTPMGAQFRL